MKLRARSMVAVVLCVCAAAGCGSETSSDDKTCSPGATQSCTCNGSDTGAQVCAASGEGWGACDCSAGTGGSSASGGSSAAGGSGGSSAGGSGGSGGTAGGDSGISGDPCPTEPMVFDCSGQCGGPSVIGCTDETCHFGLPLNITDADKYVARTAPGPFSKECPCFEDFPDLFECCQGKYGPMYRLHALQATQGYRLKVGKPWYVGFATGGDGTGSPTACGEPPSSPFVFEKGCVVGGVGNYFLISGETNPPARNIVLEPTKGNCQPSDYWE